MPSVEDFLRRFLGRFIHSVFYGQMRICAALPLSGRKAEFCVQFISVDTVVDVDVDVAVTVAVAVDVAEQYQLTFPMAWEKGAS